MNTSRLVVLLGVLALLVSCGRPAADPDREYARSVMKETYQWIRDYVDPSTGLPYDNHQKAEYTSSTNIGLYVVSVATAANLGMEDRAEAVRRINLVLDSVAKFETYKGWHQCWNSTKTLQPSPHDPVVSTLDLGNYYAGWIAVRQLLPETSERVTAHLATMKWSDLYDEQKGYLYGGYNRKTNGFTPGWYLDLMGTDARLAIFLAIAQGEIPPDAWSRIRTPLIRHNDLAYYEPGWMGGGLFMQMISGLFVDERATAIGKAAADFAYAQMMLARAIEAPAWGWSSSDSPRDGYLGWGNMKRKVVTPHATALTAMYYPRRAAENLRALEQLGARAPIAVGAETKAYGFRDAYDWTTGEVTNNYLVLDQAMLFLALANSFEEGIVWKAFHADPIVQKGLELVPDLKPTQAENLALYGTRDAGELPAAAAAGAEAASTILVEDATNRSLDTNLLGGKAQAWNRDDADRTQGCRASRMKSGPQAGALVLDYDVESPNGAWNGYRTDFNGADARACNALVIEMMADPAVGNPGNMKIELTGPAGASTFRLAGIESQMKRHVIPLADMEGMNLEWSKVGTLVFVFEDGRAAAKVGRLVIARIALEKLADTELAEARMAGKFTLGLVESFDAAAAFSPSAWEGAKVTPSGARGRTAGALELKYDLAATEQWIQAERGVSWRLPPRMRVAFDLQWSGKRNVIELKFIDADGSVFGAKILDLPPAGRWSTMTLEPGQIAYLWGGNRSLDEVTKLSIAVSTSGRGEGGAGVVRFDNLRIEALP